MKYCVIKDTTTIIDGSENPIEIMLKNAINAGFVESEVEILTEGEYLVRAENEPKPLQEPTELEELANYVLDVDFRVVMLEMGL